MLLSSSSSSQLATDNNLDSCKLVFSFVNAMYKDYKHKGDWNKALRPDVDNASAMVNDPAHPSGINKCWNCRKLDCNVMTCQKPKDTARIATNRKLLYHQKQKDRDAEKPPKTHPKTLKLFLLFGAFQNPMRTTKESFMDAHTPTILPNLAGMNMRPLLVGLQPLNHNHPHLLLMMTTS